MRRKSKKKIKKKSLKKASRIKRSKIKRKQNSQPKTINLQKVMSFQPLLKA